MTRVYICLICDVQRATFRRLRPLHAYACESCVKQHGGVEHIVGQIEEHKRKFVERHTPAPKRVIEPSPRGERILVL